MSLLLASSSEESESSNSSDENTQIKDSKDKNIKALSDNKPRHVNYKSASFIEQIFFSWSNFAIEQAKKRKITPSQISALDKSQTTDTNLKETLVHWEKYKNNKSKYPLIMGLYLTNRMRIITCVGLDIFMLLLEYFIMYMENRMVSQFSTFHGKIEDNKSFRLKTISYIALLLLGKVLLTFTFSHWDFMRNITSERVTNEASALIFKKLLKINTNANVNSKEDGEKLNLVQEDCENIGYLFSIMPRLIIYPVKIITSMSMLFKLFGFTSFYCIAALGIGLIFILIIQTLYVKNYKNYLFKKDIRMKELVNTLQTIKQVKMNGMDDFFLDKISQKYDNEMIYARGNLYLAIGRSFVINNLSIIMKIIIISLQIYNNSSIEVSAMFTSLNLIKAVTIPFFAMPDIVTGIVQNLISVERIQEFLNSPEHDFGDHKNQKAMDEEDIMIKYEDASFGITLKENENKKEEGKGGILNLFKGTAVDENINDSDKEENYENLEEEEEKQKRKAEEEKIKKEKQKKIDSSSSEKESLNKNKSTVITLLKNITIEIKKGEFIGIIGKTGSGKTCLINSILNNYELLSSSSPIIVNGRVSFEPQLPFIINDTVKNNILFDAPYDEERYNKILECCQLIPDIERFTNNDNLKLSLNGANISGGQKARISLARCLYRDADVYLLDDPLNSIDSKNSRRITQHAFMEYLKDKTRILATNEPHDLRIFDKLILMDHSQIQFFGTPAEFEMTYKGTIDFIQRKGKKKRKLSYQSKNSKDIKDNEEEKEEEESPDDSEERKKEEERLKKERKIKKYNSGRAIPLELYHTFIKLQGGYFLFFILLGLIFIKEQSRSKNQRFTASWSKTANQIEINKNSSSLMEDAKNQFWINFKMFMMVNLIELVLSVILDYAVSLTKLRMEKNLFTTMISHLIKAPINLFLGVIPIGHIINRLTNDTNKVWKIITLIHTFLLQIITVFTSCYLCFQYNKYSLIIAPFFIIFTIVLAKSYLPASRNLERLHRTTFAPIITKFTEAIKGVETIRVLRAEDSVTKKIFKRLDTHFGVHLFIEGADKHFIIFLNCMVHLFYCIEISYLVFHIESTTAQEIGLLLQQLSIISRNLIYGIRTYKDLQVIFVCLQRCDAYSKIESERIEGKIKVIGEDKLNHMKPNQIISHSKHSPIHWPTKGKVNFKRYYAKYREELPYVLNDINLEINPGEKMGIVGRTGSGKSSMILGLCRIIEGSEGLITIDDVDIAKINLYTLRNSLTVISQDTFLIEGTLRENLDPFNNHSEKELIEVLDDFRLFSQLDKESRLNFKVFLGGSNLSAGERQLICFARAALMNNKIVIMDEATASIDTQTEKITQENIKKYFNDKTLIIIAHHIQMVSECDRIAVVDNGEIVECDTFDNLLKNKEGKFHELYEENLTLLK
ncbi:MAG: ATP-binding cassette domain-containing protein [archaeon]|nr:ATP-binding cassette domain-containing protein [archaeon]